MSNDQRLMVMEQVQRSIRKAKNRLLTVLILVAACLTFLANLNG